MEFRKNGIDSGPAVVTRGSFAVRAKIVSWRLESLRRGTSVKLGKIWAIRSICLVASLRVTETMYAGTSSSWPKGRSGTVAQSFFAIAPFPIKNDPRERMMSLGAPSAIRKVGAGSAPVGLEIPLGFAQFKGIRGQRGRFGSGTRSSGLWRLRGTCVLLRRLRLGKFFCNLRRFPEMWF